MKNYLFVTGDLDLSKGGPKLSLLGLTNSLAGLGHLVTVVGESRVDSRDDNWGFSKSVKLIPCKTRRYNRRHITIQSLLVAIRLMRVKHKFDCVIYHTPWIGSVFFFEFARLIRGWPLAVFPRGSFSEKALRVNSTKKRLFMWILPTIYRSKKTIFIALSGKEKEQTALICRSKKLFIVPNATDDLRTTKPADTNEINILYLGRIAAGKGIERLLEGWSEFITRGGNDHFKLKFAGQIDGFKGPSLLKLIRDSKIFNVEYMGQVEGDNKISLLNQVDYFILLSESEGQSMAMVESLSVGLPIIISSECNYEHVRENGVGFCLEPCDDLILTLDSIGKMDKKRYLKMRMNARRLYEQHHTWNQVATEFLEVLETS